MFPANFGGQPMSVTLRGHQHFVRLAGVSRLTEAAMKNYVRFKMGDDASGRGRGGRRGGGRRGFQNRGDEYEGSFSPLETSHLEDNPLDMLATIYPTDTKQGGNQDNAYKSDNIATTDSSGANAGPLNVQDLMNKLIMAGLLPTGDKKGPEKSDEAKEEKKESNTETAMDTSEPEPQALEKAAVAGPPPLEVVNISLTDNLRERRITLINQICTGMQCASCGLRFAPDQSLR
jgi:hypothetical protein